MSVEEVTDVLSELAIPWSLYLVPTNLESERKKFFSSSTYNPQFKYRKARKNNDSVFAKLSGLQEITGVDPEIAKYIFKTIECKKQAAKILELIGTDEAFARVSTERFGVPSYRLFRKACKILRGYYKGYDVVKRDKKLKAKKLRYDDLVEIFNKAFDIFGLEGWSVGKSKSIMSSGVRTAVKTKRVMLDPEIETSAERIRKTIIHEVGTHSLRGYNGYETGYDVFGKPNITSYLDDEEGLALYNEEKYGVLRKKDLKRRAAMVYAVYLSQKFSFRDVFNSLRAVYPRKSAFNVTLRVKRGMSDTTKPGGFNKDIVYFRGFLNLRKKLEGDKLSYRYLYAGKIPFDYIYLVEEGIIPKPKVYPTDDLIKKLLKKAGLE